MEYKYDPILCMNIPVEKSKAKDASWKAWTLYIDGKWVKSFTSEMAPIKEAQKFMKENYPGKVGKLVRNTGSSSGYSISGSESRDSISSVDKAIKSCDEDGIRYSVAVKRKSDGKRRAFNVVARTKSAAFRNAIAQAVNETGGKESDYTVVDYIQY